MYMSCDMSYLVVFEFSVGQRAEPIENFCFPHPKKCSGWCETVFTYIYLNCLRPLLLLQWWLILSCFRKPARTKWRHHFYPRSASWLLFFWGGGKSFYKKKKARSAWLKINMWHRSKVLFLSFLLVFLTNECFYF